MKLKHISVSQYKTYTDCHKKWYIEKVVGIKTPGTAATEFGSKFHDFMEKWVESHGSIKIPSFMQPYYRASTSFFTQLANLKNPKIEEELNYILPESQVPFIGYVDLQSDTGKVEDYKTVGSWKWALREDGLRDDVQMNMYAHLIKDTQTSTHYQFNKQTNMMKTVTVPFDPRRGQKTHDLIDQAAMQMQADANKSIEEVEKNIKSCKNYGGCPFREYCTNQCSIKELKVKIENPHVKERSKEELNNMESEDRILELASELDHSKKVNKKIGSLKENMNKIQEMKQRQAAKRERLAEEKKQSETLMENTSNENNTVTNRETTVMDNKPPVETSSVDEVVTNDSPEPSKEPEKIKPKTKRAKAKQKVEVKTTTPTILIDTAFSFSLTTPNITPVSPTTLLHEKMIQPILDKHKADVMGTIPFNEGIRDLSAYAQTIIDILKEEEYIVLNTTLPVDRAIWGWILETRRFGEFNVFGNPNN